MSRSDCISNRNIKIIASYVAHKLGGYGDLFGGLSYPAEYRSPEHFFLDECQWTTLQTFQHLLRRGKSMVGEPYFYFHCGAFSSSLQHPAALNGFSHLFSSPSHAFRSLPYVSKSFTGMKEIELISPPSYDERAGKLRTLLKLTYDKDADINGDYIGHTFTRGLIAAIPTAWGGKPASIRQPLNPCDPEILFSAEPEFSSYNLDLTVDGDSMTVRASEGAPRRIIGKKIFLEPESRNGCDLYLSRHTDCGTTSAPNGKSREAFLVTDTVKLNDRILLKAGEIYKAPYYILDVTYERPSVRDRISQFIQLCRKNRQAQGTFSNGIPGLREMPASENKSYQVLKRENVALMEAVNKANDHSSNLKKRLEEVTSDLERAREEIHRFKQGVDTRVRELAEQLKKYGELRRYLSPKLSEKILSSGEKLHTEPHNKMMTVVFTDIRNFSACTESIGPEALFPLLDKYFSEMTKIIHHYDGTLNKMIGDGMLIFFGDPIPAEDHAEKAVLMAVEMQNKVAELKKDWLERGHDFGIGIGINTGTMTVGTIGSDMHKDYTVIGNQVNVASRLESLAKPGQILISHQTYRELRHPAQVEKIGEIQVTGLREPVTTYNVKVTQEALPCFHDEPRYRI
jgi:adenylate cyclase